MKHLIKPKYRVYFIAILVVFTATILSRTITLFYFLPYYSIDENDIVEYAVVYLCGNWDPNWYIYGPLYSYVLAGVYFIYSLFVEGSLDAYIIDIFFRPTKFYLIARIINVFVNLLIAYLTYKLAYHVFANRRRAIIAFLIAIFPFFDIITNFKPRVDTFLALFVVLSLIQLVLIYKTNRTRHYVLLGLFTGFALASKPLPALLILPTILLVIPLAKLRSNKSLAYWQRNKIIQPIEDLNILKKIKTVFSTLISYRSLLIAFFILLGNFIGNPFSFLSFYKYFSTQMDAISEQGGRDFVQGWDISRFFNNLGLVFVIIGITAVLFWTFSCIRKRKYESLLLIVYLISFWVPFALGAARDYFYVPILPIIIIATSYIISEFSLRFNKKYRPYIAIASVLVLLIQPSVRLIGRDVKLIVGNPYTEHTLTAAYNYLEDNIDPNNNFLVIGPTPNLPKLVFRDIDLYSRVERNGVRSDLYGDYFMYGRGSHPRWVLLFRRAHENILSEERYIIREGDFHKGELSPLNIYRKIENNNYDYFITSYDYTEHAYFKSQLLAQFDEPEYAYGHSLFIYKIKKGHIFENPVSAIDYLILGMRARENNNNDIAAVHYRRAFEIDSTNSRILFELGVFEYYNRNYQTAYNYFNKGSRLDNTSFHMIYNKGLCMMNLQQFRNAIQEFNAAEKLDTEEAQLYLRRGLCYINIGNREQACLDFGKASEMNEGSAQDYLATYCR